MTYSPPTLAQRLTGWVARWMYADPLMLGAGGTVYGATRLYDARNALSAMAAFPWVLACLETISTDLSGLPLIAVERAPNGKRNILTEHPLLDLLERPSPQSSGVEMRRQLYVDFAAVREAYIRRIGEPGEMGSVLTRLHPVDCEPQVNTSTGLIESFKWGSRYLSPGEVLMIRGPGWDRGIRSARAVSPIQALESGLLAAREARDHAQKSAKRGQIQMLLKPSDPIAQFGEEGVKRVVDAWVKAAEEGNGVFVLNRALDAIPLSLSPRELEFSKLSTDVRDETLAVFGVPPSIVGIPGANYGTSRQEARTYWERRAKDAALFDAALSRWTGNPRITIEHDLTDVEALQSTRTERQQRASAWVTGFGVKPADAAAYEDFPDAPIDPNLTAADVASLRPNAPPVTEPQESRAMAAVREWQAGAAERMALHAAEGGDVAVLLDLEAGLLRACLVRAGFAADVAQSRARQYAQIAVDAVRLALDTSAAVEVSKVRVFERRFAEAICSE
jgi:hypothetical protein